MKTPKALAVSLAACAALAPVALALTPTGPGEFRLETESDVSHVADGFAVPAGSTITVRPGVFRPEGGPVAAPPPRERRTPGSCPPRSCRARPESSPTPRRCICGAPPSASVKSRIAFGVAAAPERTAASGPSAPARDSAGIPFISPIRARARAAVR